jgi:hypothetical protein
LSLRGNRSNLAFFDQIATLARRSASARRHACVPERLAAHICFNKDKHFGVQARTFSRF